jgi:hypothetical protein
MKDLYLYPFGEPDTVSIIAFSLGDLDDIAAACYAAAHT